MASPGLEKDAGPDSSPLGAHLDLKETGGISEPSWKETRPCALGGVMEGVSQVWGTVGQQGSHFWKYLWHLWHHWDR